MRKQKTIFDPKTNREFTIFTEHKNGTVTLAGLKDILNSMRIDISNDAIVEDIYKIFVYERYSYDDAWKVLSGASKMKVLCKKGQERVSVELKQFFDDIRTGANLEMFKKMGEIDQKFKQYIRDDLYEIKREGLLTDREYKSEKMNALSSIDQLIKSAWKKIKDVTKDFDESLEKFTLDELENLYNYACIYDAIVKHTPTRSWTDAEGNEYLRVADNIFANRYLRLKKPTELSETALSIQKLLDAMEEYNEKYGEKERFLKRDIADILVKAPILMNISCANKFRANQECLISYVKELNALAQNSDLESAMSNLSAKKIIKGCPSLIANSESATVQATNFLLGKTIDEINDQYPQSKTVPNARKLVDHFPNLQIGNMTLEDNLRIATKQGSILANINFASIYNIEEVLLDAIIGAKYPDKKLAKLDITAKKQIVKELKIDYNHLITGKNVSTLFRSDVKKCLRSEKMVDMTRNISLLLEYVNMQTVVNAMRNNINVLLQPEGVLQEKIDDILKVCSIGSAEFKKAFVKMLNDEYNAGLIMGDVDTSPRPRITIGTGEKVGPVKDDVNVTFVGADIPTKWTDNEKYEYVRQEIVDLGTFCNLLNECDNTQDILAYWANMCEELKDSNCRDSALVGQLSRSILNYKENTKPKGAISRKLKNLVDVLNSIESQDLKSSLQAGLQEAIKAIGATGEKLSLAQKSLNEQTGKFYVESKARTHTTDTNGLKEAQKKLLSNESYLKKIIKNKSLIADVISGSEQSRKKIDEEIDEVENENAEYKTRKTNNDKLETLTARLYELRNMLEISAGYLQVASDSIPKAKTKQKVAPIIEEKDDKDELKTRLEALKKLVGQKTFDEVKAHYKGKDFKRYCYNKGLAVGDKTYEVLREIAEILNKQDRLNRENGKTTK